MVIVNPVRGGNDFLALARTTADFLVAATVATETPPGCPEAEIKAVIDVIRNRVDDAQFPDTPLMVVLQPKQFSGTMRGLSAGALGHSDIWARAVAGYWQREHVARCLDLWRRSWDDTTDNACWYYSPVGMRPPGAVPGWAHALQEVEVEGVRPDYFRFFKEVP